jgi:hypothetical protein
VTNSPNFEDVSYIKAFLAYARSHKSDLCVQYPRCRRGNDSAPDSDGRNFDWFVQNGQRGRRLALPGLDDAEGLPYFPRH